MLRHLGLVAQLAGGTGGLQTALDSHGGEDLVKARHLLALQQQLEALQQREAGIRRDVQETQARADKTEEELNRRRLEAMAKAQEGETMSEALQRTTAELDVAKARLQVVSVETAEKERAYEEKLHEQKTAVAERTNDLAKGKIESNRDATEGALLVRLLQAELEKWKHTALRLRSNIDIQDKEEAKNNILLAILNAQLITSRDEASTLRDEASARRDAVLKAEGELAVAEDRRAELVSVQGQLEARVHQSQSEHDYTIARMAARERREESSVASLEAELAAVVEAYSEYGAKAALRSRDAHERQARLSAEISKFKSIEAELGQSTRECEEMKVTGEAQRQDEITKKLISLETLAKKSDMEQKKIFEDSMSCQSESELLQHQISILQRRTREFEEMSTVDLLALRDKITCLKSTVETIRRTAAASEKESFETITKICAANECMRQRVLALQSVAANSDSEHIKERIALATESAEMHKKVRGLDAQLKAQQVATREGLEGLRRDKEAVVSSGYEEHDVRREVGSIREHKHAVLHEREVGLKRLESLEIQTRQKDRYIKDRFVAYEAEAKALQSEIKSLVREVAKLEVTVAETHEYRAKAEENSLLEDEIKTCKVEIRHMHNVISTMTVEKGLLDGYKAKVLTEQNGEQLRKLKQLERSRSSFAPLLLELLATAKRHGVADEAVAAAELISAELACATNRYATT